MDARDTIFDYFQYVDEVDDRNLYSLMRYLDTDTLVAWFVDEGYIDDVKNELDHEIIMEYYEKHC